MKVNVQRMVGLGGLEPPTSPLSEGSAIADKPYSKAFSRVWEIKFPDSSQIFFMKLAVLISLIS